MALTAQDVQSFLIANPNLSDAQIASLANQYGVSAQTLSEATSVPVATIEQRAAAAGAPLTGGMLTGAPSPTATTTAPVASTTAGGIPPRPTFDTVFTKWNEAHKARFGTYVNLATVGQKDVDNQLNELQDTLKQEQAAWDKQYGDTETAKAIKENPPPTWGDVYGVWSQQHQQIFGVPFTNRPWNTDQASIDTKNQLDKAYLDALADYNAKNGTNIAPDPAVLGTNVQPSAIFAVPKKEKWYQSPEGVLKTVAPFALMAIPGMQGVAASIGTSLGATGAAAMTVGNAVITGLTTGAITGDVEKALIAGTLAAGGTYLTQSGTLGNVFDNLGLGEYKDTFGIIGGNTSEASMAATDATRLAQQGLSQNQIAEVLLQQSGITNPELIRAASQLASLGVPQSQITNTLNDIIKTTPAPVSSIGGAFDVAGNPDIVGGTSAGLFGGTAAGATTGAVTGATTGAATGATTGAATGAATSLGTGLLANAGQSLLNTLTKPETLQGLLNAGIDYATAERIANQMRDEAAGIQQQAVNIGQAAQVPFTPYTLTTGTGTSTVGPTGATAMLSPELQALQRQQIGLAGETLGAINPAKAAETLYGQVEALAAPTRQREQERLLGTLGARGLLGIGRNLPTTGGEVRGVNPFMESLLSAQETARAQQALQATQFGTSEAIRQQQLAAGLQSGALGLDTQAMNQLAAARAGQGLSQAQANRNAALLAEAQLKGLGYQIPLLESAASIQAGQTRSLGTAGQRLSGNLFGELFGGTPLSNLTYNGQTWGGTVENPWYG